MLLKIKLFVFALLLLANGGGLYAQNISTIAGGSSSGFSGDGSLATLAALNGPQDVALDTFGNLYIADAGNHRIRKITAATGIISTVAGTGVFGYSGDGGLATAAQLYAPIGISVDPTGNVYIADLGNNRIRKITVATGIISTVAGTGVPGYLGDGAAATSARLYNPYDVTVDNLGNIFIADVSNNCIRKVTASTGFISTVAGTTVPGFSGDGGLATAARLYQPFGVAIDTAGNLYITDAANNRIRKVTKSTGFISTIGGTGTAGFSGDGGAATSAQMNKPYSITLGPLGDVYFSDFNNHRIRKITTSTGVISSISGTGVSGFSGDGGLAISAQLSGPKGIFVDKVKNVFIADELNNRIRFICNAATIPTAPLVTSPVTFCTSGTPTPLSAIGTSLKWYTSSSGGVGSTSAPIPSLASVGSTTYYVTQSSACGESPRSAIVVNVIAAPIAPTVGSAPVYCSGDVASPLVATGSLGLLWHTVAIGGTAATTAPTPNTSVAGTYVFYVSQGTSDCESPRVAISVWVKPSPNAPVVSDISYCLNASPMALTAVGTNLKWFTVSTGGVSAATAPTPITSVDGTVDYYVSQTNGLGCESPRANIRVNTRTKPKVSITAATFPKFYVCKGAQLTLKSIVAPYGIDYKWQLASIDIPSATADTLNVVDAGNYSIIVSNAPNCNDTASVLVEIDSSFTKTAITPTDINICDGVNIKLFATTSLGIGYKYQWLKDGILLADTNNNLVVNTKGLYTLKVTNAQGCSVISNPSNVHTFSPIIDPIISQLGNVLSVPNIYARYQWYRNKKLIPSATTFFYTMMFDGQYSVQVGDIHTCFKESAVLNVLNLSLETVRVNKQFSIFPNPTTGLLIIESAKAVETQVLDVLGRVVLRVNNAKEIDLRPMPNGLYYVKCFDTEASLLGIECVSKIN